MKPKTKLSKPIAVEPKVHEKLSSLKQKNESFNDVINRLIEGVGDVYHEFILIDNELPRFHTVVFQLGEDRESLYYFDGADTNPTTSQKVNAMQKQPKPNATITIEEAKRILSEKDLGKPLFDKLTAFVENQP